MTMPKISSPSNSAYQGGSIPETTIAGPAAGTDPIQRNQSALAQEFGAMPAGAEEVGAPGRKPKARGESGRRKAKERGESGRRKAKERGESGRHQPKARGKSAAGRAPSGGGEPGAPSEQTAAG
jgi:hypothetical protein